MINPASSTRTKELRFSHSRNQSEGTIVSFTKVWMASSDYYGKVPYYLALVKLTDGTKTMGQVVDTNELKTGMNVEACMRKLNVDGNKGIIEYGTKFRVTK